MHNFLVVLSVRFVVDCVKKEREREREREMSGEEDLDISIDAEVDDFLSSLDPELLKGVVEEEEGKDVSRQRQDDVVSRRNEEDKEKREKEEREDKEKREKEMDEREQKLLDLLRKLQKKQIALHERESRLEERETELSRREREIRNEASRMEAKEKVVIDGLGRAANQEVNLKRWLDELQKTKANLKRAEIEWLRRTKEKASSSKEEEEEKGPTNNISLIAPSASELLENTPTLRATEDSPDSDKAIHESCVRLKAVASFLIETFDRVTSISEQLAITCDTMSKFTSLIGKPRDQKDVLSQMLGTRCFKELQRFSNAVVQLHQFMELLGHSLSQAVARPVCHLLLTHPLNHSSTHSIIPTHQLADIVHNSIEDALALNLRLQEDRGLLDDATERLLNTRLVKRSSNREKDGGMVGFALQNLFGATNLISSGGDHASLKSAVQTLEYQWRLRRFDVIAASNLAAKHARVRVAETAASGLLAFEAFVTQTSSSLCNVAQIAAPLLSSCQSATSMLTSLTQRNRVEREQLQAETTWRANYKDDDEEEKMKKKKAPTPVKTGLKKSECIRKGYLRLRTRAKGLGPRCWFEITSKGMMRYRKHWREPVKPLVDLLLCAIRSCDDFEEPFPFSFEIHTPKKRYCFQARSDEERRCWVKTLRNAASARLSTHTKSKTSNSSKEEVERHEEEQDDNKKNVLLRRPKLSPAQERQKNLLEDLKTRLKKLNPNCADCGDLNPDWVCLNLGVLCCHQCAGVHRSLEFAFVRSLELDTINVLELRMMEACGGNETANKIWQAQSQSGWNSPTPKSKMKERKRWIEAKYVWAGFTKSSDETRERWCESLNDAASKGNVFTVLECLARRRHVMRDSEMKGEKKMECAIQSSLQISRDGGHVLCERLIMMYA